MKGSDRMESSVFPILKLNCAVYLRVSTDLENQQNSFGNQKSYFERLAKEKNWDCTEFYHDYGVSGTSMAKRDGLKRLLRDAKEKKFSIVICKSLSRLARDTSDALKIYETLKEHGIELYTAKEGRVENEFLYTILSSLNQAYSEELSRNVKWGIKESSRKGVFHGPAPYGYKKENKTKLIPEPTTASIVKRIFKMYNSDGLGTQAIANILNDEKIPTSRKHNATWHDSTIRTILKNPHYIGDLVQNRSEMDRGIRSHIREKGYAERKLLMQEEWVIIKNTHEPLIQPEVFEAVQVKLKERGIRSFKGRGKKSLFARIAFCSTCGKGMVYKKDRNGYVCSTYQKHGKKACLPHAIKHNNLKENILNDLISFTSVQVDQDKVFSTLRNRLQNQTKDIKLQLEGIEKNIVKVQQNLINASIKLTENVLSDTTFQLMQKNFEVQLKLDQTEKSRLLHLLNEQKEADSFILNFKKQVDQLLRLDFNDEESLRDLLHLLIEKIEIEENGDQKVYYKFFDKKTSMPQV